MTDSYGEVIGLTYRVGRHFAGGTAAHVTHLLHRPSRQLFPSCAAEIAMSKVVAYAIQLRSAQPSYHQVCQCHALQPVTALQIGVGVLELSYQFHTVQLKTL